MAPILIFVTTFPSKLYKRIHYLYSVRLDDINSVCLDDIKVVMAMACCTCCTYVVNHRSNLLLGNYLPRKWVLL